MHYTKKDAYIFGYVTGIIDRAAQEDENSYISFDTILREAQYHPYIGFTKIYLKAQKGGLIDRTLDDKIGIALDEIDINFTDKIKNGADYLPAKLQGVWFMAYRKGKKGSDFNPPKDDEPEK